MSLGLPERKATATKSHCTTSAIVITARSRLHTTLGNAHRTTFADHRPRPGDQLLGLVLHGASDREFPVCRWAAALFFHRDTERDRRELFRHRWSLPAV